jgi:hypothetical protein
MTKPLNIAGESLNVKEVPQICLKYFKVPFSLILL